MTANAGSYCGQHEIKELYEKIMDQNGVYCGTLTQKAFFTMYKRYKQLRGVILYKWNSQYELPERLEPLANGKSCKFCGK